MSNECISLPPLPAPDSCPFCGGKGKVSFKDYQFGGQNVFGNKRIRYRVQVICNKCKSRGKPIITDYLINPNPYISIWGNVYYVPTQPQEAQTELFRAWVVKAIEAWNRRAGESNE